MGNYNTSKPKHSNSNKNKDLREKSKFDKTAKWCKTPRSNVSDKNMYQDPFWYGKDITAIKDMASFPWLEIVGTRIKGTATDAVPGMIALTYRHAINTNALQDGSLDNRFGNYATRAARAYYNYVVQGFSSSVPFEAPDLMMTALAAASVRAWMLEGFRAYTVLAYYVMQNKYYAKDIMQGLGFDYSDWISNKARFRTQYNLRVRAMNNTLVIPKGLFISDRWDFIASNLFTDTTSPDYSSLMGYVNRAVLKFDATTAKYGTCLKWKETTTPGKLLTVDDFFNIVDDLLNALNDDDVRSIFASVLRVYPVGNLKMLSEITEESPNIPVFRNDVVAATFHNAIWANSPAESNSSKKYCRTPAAYMISGTESNEVVIYQDNFGNILTRLLGSYSTTEPSLNTPSKALATDVILDMYDNLITPENVLDITASMQIAGEMETGVAGTYPIYCRAEYITGLYVLGDFTSTNGSYNPTMNPILDNWNGTFSPSLCALTHIDSFPIVPFRSTAPGTAITGYLGELDKYTTISRETLALLHDRCLFNMLLMPENTKSIT
uniref:Capsid n=1 Tax=Picobirnaviridae sp. ctQQI1 TaxID=2828015 RepID=A0A8S5TIV6_9VIRU|nr:MAG TPA: capsid [Picobirnaviridae sp. ctQQI1]